MNLFINFNNLLKFILFLNFFIYPILIIKRNKKNNIIVKNCNFKITRLKLIFKHNIEEIIESRYIFPKVRSRETRRIFPDWCLCVKERDRETHKEYWSKASETVPSLLFESNRVESNRIMAPEGNKFWPIIHRLSDRKLVPTIANPNRQLTLSVKLFVRNFYLSAILFPFRNTRDWIGYIYRYPSKWRNIYDIKLYVRG